MNVILNMRKGKLGNKNRRTLAIQIVEHVYDGSPRWRENVKKTYKLHTKDRTSPIAREKDVRNSIDNAWGRPFIGQKGKSAGEKFSGGIWDLGTCINPDCDQRSQNVMKFTIHHTHSAIYPIKCQQCGKDMPLLHFKPIERKWIYVFSGKSKNMELAYEMFAETKDDWLVLRKPNPSRSYLPIFEGKKRHKRVFKSGARLKVKKGETYHFFLSPVQLGKKSLKKLLAGDKNSSSSGKRVNESNGLNEQLDTNLIVRKFNDAPKQTLDPLGKKKNNPEIVAVIDPFAFVIEAKEWDFLPIVQALYNLQFDKNERAKKNIASILTALIGELSEDKFDLIDEIHKHAKSINGSHNAKSWLDAQKKCMDFLSRYVEEAALRLVEWLDSDAHWIVELSIQEHSDNPEILALGITHYTSIIKDILANSVGQAYITRLESKEKVRLPYKFILYPTAAEKNANNKVRKKYGDLPAQLLALLMPVIINKSNDNNRAENIVKHLKDLGVDALVTGNINPAPGFGYKGFQIVKNSLLAIDEARIEKVGKSYLPERIHNRIKPGLKVFTQFESHIEATFNIFAGIKVYTQKAKPSDSPLDQAVRTKTKWEYPFQAAKYASDISKLSLAIWANKKYGIEIEKLAMGSRTTYLDSSSDSIKALLRNKKNFVILSRNAKFYSWITRVSKYLIGPVALVFGGIDMLIQTRQTIVGWEDGNSGGAVGSAMLLSAAALGVTAAVVETLSLIGVISQASATSLLGPIGILAALITVGAMVVFALFSKSDLELYASHCFLGNEYGEGSSGPNWASGVRYKSWKAWPDAIIYQNIYLFNLMSSVKVLIRHHPIMGAAAIKYGAFVQTGYLPYNARCEVVVIGKYADFTKGENGKTVDIKSTAYIDISTGEYIVVGDKKYPPPKAIVYSVPSNSWGKKEFGHFAVSLNHTCKNVRSIYERDKWGRLQDMYYCEVKVRIDIGNRNYMPNGYDGTHYLELHNLKGFMGEYIKKWP